MDFNSLIGTSAYVAKQLELKWFYHWEMITSQCDDGDDAPKGRLVRKRHHSMPFLHRNIIAHSNSWDGRRSPSRYSSVAGRRDEFDLHEFATSKLPAAAAARTKQRSTKRKMVEAVEESSYYQAKGKKNKKSKSDNNDKVVAIGKKKSNNQQRKFAPTFTNIASLQLHLQNPIKRKKIIDQVPKELHHGETYILECTKESWLRNNNKYDMKDGEISTNNGGDTINHDTPATAISAYLPTDIVPLRQYYHASTNLPMTHSDCMKDSDEETDETWLHEMQSELLDEFEDVSPKEKQFMKLWNRYIKCNHVIADKDMPMKCHLFTLEYRKQLMDDGMRLNFLLHLFNLWDSGVISSARILSCMSLFDEVAGNEDKILWSCYP